MKPTYQVNKSTIIMPCNNTGFTDPTSTVGWSVIDFDWSNSKGTGTADGWAKHKPMDDEELLMKQVDLTVAASPETTVWIYRNTVYGYPWYTSVREKLEDPDYADWFIKFKSEGPWYSSKCDNNYDPPLCSDFYHSQEQSPGYPHGDGDCASPGCDCGKVPCGFYIFNHSTTTTVNNETFRDWFINGYNLNAAAGASAHVSGFFWDDVWNPQCNIHDQVKDTCTDMGLTQDDLNLLTHDYLENMAALREATLSAGKFSWQMLWTGGVDDSIGSTGPQPLVNANTCATDLRRLCNATGPAQTRAMMFALHGQPEKLTDVEQDLANFLLVRGPYGWLGHGWKGCSRQYEFPKEFNQDVGEPLGICKETAPGSQVFTRKWTKATVQMNCSDWTAKITKK
jgi:hypothetical protein